MRHVIRVGVTGRPDSNFKRRLFLYLPSSVLNHFPIRPLQVPSFSDLFTCQVPQQPESKPLVNEFYLHGKTGCILHIKPFRRAIATFLIIQRLPCRLALASALNLYPSWFGVYAGCKRNRKPYRADKSRSTGYHPCCASGALSEWALYIFSCMTRGMWLAEPERSSE